MEKTEAGYILVQRPKNDIKLVKIKVFIKIWLVYAVVDLKVQFCCFYFKKISQFFC